METYTTSSWTASQRRTEACKQVVSCSYKLQNSENESETGSTCSVIILCISLEYLTTCGLQQFADTFATKCFLRRLDQLFDHLNCRSLYGTPHGKPLLGQIMGCYWHFGSGLPALVTCTARADMPAVANQQWATSCHKQQPIDVFTSSNPLLTLK